jgi:hypothetical protein
LVTTNNQKATFDLRPRRWNPQFGVCWVPCRTLLGDAEAGASGRMKYVMPRPVNEIQNAILCPGMRHPHCSPKKEWRMRQSECPPALPTPATLCPHWCPPPNWQAQSMGQHPNGKGGQGRLWVWHPPRTQGGRHRAWHISPGEASWSAVANTKGLITLPLPLAPGMNARRTQPPPPLHIL